MKMTLLLGMEGLLDHAHLLAEPNPDAPAGSSLSLEPSTGRHLSHGHNRFGDCGLLGLHWENVELDLIVVIPSWALVSTLYSTLNP